MYLRPSFVVAHKKHSMVQFPLNTCGVTGKSSMYPSHLWRTSSATCKCLPRSAGRLTRRGGLWRSDIQPWHYSERLQKSGLTWTRAFSRSSSLWATLKVSVYSFVFNFSLPAKFEDSVDSKDGLLNNRVCTVKFLEVNFSCNTIHTV